MLSLPDYEVALCEVLSWSPDSATANALLASCHLASQLRHDPAAAALLLTRCRCSDYEAALASCSSTCNTSVGEEDDSLPEDGGATAVILQVLQLGDATVDSGGPFTVPPQLLQALLYSASATANEAVLHHLMELDDPPDVNAGDGRALLLALRFGAADEEEDDDEPTQWGLDRAVVYDPRLSAMDALLTAGADPCIDRMALIREAASAPGQALCLELLLQHCHEMGERPRAAAAALTAAIESDRAGAAELALDCLGRESVELSDLIAQANKLGSARVLRMLLDRDEVQWEDLGDMSTSSFSECADMMTEHCANQSGADGQWEGVW